MKKSRGLFTGIVVLCILVVALELLARAVLPDSRLGMLEAIQRVLEEDVRLFWRVKPHLDTDFAGVRIATNAQGFRSGEIMPKKKGSLRVIVLGASPDFGWGVESGLAYPAVLEKELSVRYPGREIEVINAGQIGYTSHQGLVLLESTLLKYAPDVITVSYVLNDIDRYRFYRNEPAADKELKNGNPQAITVARMLGESRVITLLRQTAAAMVFKNDKLASRVYKKQYNRIRPRVGLDDYRRNLTRIADICRAGNIGLIFLKMPVHLQVPALSEPEKAFLSGGGNSSQFYYDNACAAMSLGDFAQARALFVKAKAYQVFDLKADSILYQQKMEEVATAYGLPLVDAVDLFSRQGDGVELFNGPRDPIHPNARGHALIARALYDAIAAGGRLP